MTGRGCRRTVGVILLLCPLCIACGERGNVDQGRVIEFDKVKGTITMIRDGSPNPKKPEYTVLPPFTYTTPSDPGEMGPDPKAGLRMRLDAGKREIVIFDPLSQSFKTIRYSVIDEKGNVAKDHDLVFDKATNRTRELPVVDRKEKTISLYSARQRLFIVFTVPEEYFALPDKAWEAGDEVRIYYKQKGKALRIMNVSRTDIYQK